MEQINTQETQKEGARKFGLCFTSDFMNSFYIYCRKDNNKLGADYDGLSKSAQVVP